LHAYNRWLAFIFSGRSSALGVVCEIQEIERGTKPYTCRIAPTAASISAAALVGAKKCEKKRKEKRKKDKK
jgi:hypothetical protein